MAKTEKRFDVTFLQSGFANPDFKIIVDRETGVNYLVTMNGTVSSGITPLLNPDGTPVVTPVRKFDE